jgi:hypothetical protein
MNTIKDLAKNWWLNLDEQECHNFRIKYPDFNIEGIFYQEVIVKWFQDSYYSKITDSEEGYKANLLQAQDIIEMYLKKQSQSVDNTIDMEEKKVFNDFEEWIVVRFAETGFKGFNFDEIKEIVDKAKESREKRKAIEDNVWDEVFQHYGKPFTSGRDLWDFLKQHYSLIKK